MKSSMNFQLELLDILEIDKSFQYHPVLIYLNSSRTSDGQREHYHGHVRPVAGL